MGLNGEDSSVFGYCMSVISKLEELYPAYVTFARLLSVYFTMVSSSAGSSNILN